MYATHLRKTIHKDLRKDTRTSRKDEKYIHRGRAFILCTFIFIIVSLLAYVGNTIATYSINLPSIDVPFQRQLPESTLVYDSQGNILYTIYAYANGEGNTPISENRIYVPLSQIPTTMKLAMISAEDVNFYKEDGINLTAIVRSLFHDVFQNDSGLQGASTITQQLVKYTALTQNRTLERKIKEVILTAKISQVYSKDQILEAYFNAVPFGGSNYGIEAAAREYFGIDVGKLDLAQSAFLAGLPQAPAAYTPLLSSQVGSNAYNGAYALAKQRQLYVLDQMQRNKDITGVTDDEITSAKNESLGANLGHQGIDIKYPNFSLYVRDLLFHMYGEARVNQGGLRVFTTLDPRAQDFAQQAVSDGVKQFIASGLNIRNSSLISLNAANGNILAMVGSANYNDPSIQGEVNMTVFPISPGSSVKPFVYITGFQHGMNKDTIVHDEQSAIPTEYPALRDFDSKFQGPISISTAILQSRNIPAVEVAKQVGLQNVYNNMLLAGDEYLKNCNYGLSLAIGSCEVPLIEHASAFSVLAQDGIKHPVRAILMVKDKYGHVIYDNMPVISTRVFDDGLVREMNGIIKNYHTLVPVQRLGYIVAGKTGTGQDNKNNTFMGFSSTVVTGVWSGNTDQSSTSNNAYGEDTAAPIWNTYMSNILKYYPGNGNF